MKKGDKIRYIGHTAICKSCAEAEKPPHPVVDPDGLDDQDRFYNGLNSDWEGLIGQEGEVINVGSPTVLVRLNNFQCAAYADHLEVLA